MNSIKLSKGELTKQRLLQSAAKEFAERGYHEAKISTIVSNVNLTQPSFYLYFKNKEAIFQELISHFRKQLIPFVERTYDIAKMPHDEVPQRIQIGLSHLFQFFASDPNLTKVAFYHSEQGEEFRLVMIEMMASIFKHYQEVGLIRSSLFIEVAAEGFIAMLDRFTYRIILTNERDIDTLAKQMSDTFFYGILAERKQN
ncbi:TetR family transcriptional regulator [Paenibacillus sp. LMG 31460]|uniref:TetR family transcriptional regulator n=1 Tax=Paenibacillus germinis TaxID=2654979 RepID=A0ABX1ZA83_9BACL|nr:TetR/AcrR family transcriptional regulator [Paenibacillus germinis]NOU90236.1 TetR family transcriptional regulator [Paenibacillus germinis]